MVPFSRLTSSRYSVSPSQTARWLSRVTHAPVHLPGNAPLALAQHVVDGGGDAGQHLRALAVGRVRVEAVGKFLGDEAGRQLAGAPARMRHQRGEKRNIVADAVDHEGVERVGLRVDRLLRAWAHG